MDDNIVGFVRQAEKIRKYVQDNPGMLKDTIQACNAYATPSEIAALLTALSDAGALYDINGKYYVEGAVRGKADEVPSLVAVEVKSSPGANTNLDYALLEAWAYGNRSSATQQRCWH